MRGPRGVKRLGRMNRNSRPIRETQQLRKGRISIPGARYFMTCCCVRPCDALSSPDTAQALLHVWSRLEANGDIELLAATVMPDHVHLLYRLVGCLSPGQISGKMKALSKPTLSASDMEWQRDFWEHRLRPDEAANPYALYIFMNPYRAGLIGRTQTWPYWYHNPSVDFDFLHMLDGGLYPPEVWMDCEIEAYGLLRDHVGE